MKIIVSVLIIIFFTVSCSKESSDIKKHSYKFVSFSKYNGGIVNDTVLFKEANDTMAYREAIRRHLIAERDTEKYPKKEHMTFALLNSLNKPLFGGEDTMESVAYNSQIYAEIRKELGIKANSAE